MAKPATKPQAPPPLPPKATPRPQSPPDSIDYLGRGAPKPLHTKVATADPHK